ncbi:MAG TPA: MBL fold metallo-hydrolase [Chloroflexota bacterium]|nr:MBL fold metallo-hydrolase [Chloroflexota bacterium]
MKLLFLGTGAAQGYPAIFCRCDSCEAARDRGGKSIRRRSAALVNDDLLLDFGPDVMAAARDLRLRLHNVQYLLLTHADHDHLHRENFDQHRARWAAPEIPTLHVHGSAATLELIRNYPWPLDEMRVELHVVSPGQTWEMGPYRVTALRARHTEPQQPLFYAVRQGESALLYATDTGAFYPETWAVLDALGTDGMRLTGAVIEGTSGLRETAPTSGHMNLARCAEHHVMLREHGLTAPGCRHFGTHFSPNGAPLHEETDAFLEEHGVRAAYDGLEVQI